MSAEKIINDWKKNVFKPLYWLEGEEEFYIDVVMDYAEHKILSEADVAFNLTVFYGKDANWTEVVNACSRYPMFAQKQVVLLKEAQQMKDIDKLENYITNPLASTVLVVSYKGKTIDGRSKLAKLLKHSGEVLSTKKLYENKLPGWTNDYILSKGYTITPRALTLLVDHIGNDLSRIANEFEKVSMNVGDRKNINDDDIEKYVGISKEYNVFELQQALSKKDLAKAITIIQYFEGNPKAAPIQMLLPALYNHFSKVLSVFQMSDKSENALRPMFYNNPYAARQALETVLNYSYSGVEQTLMLLHEYNLKSVGVNSIGVSDASLMKELTVKIINHT
ncbi:MAG TPA: DNA polymerase III subunit delta [Chitinophagaceae bacterium]|nr:DNA polymerase III subunit delta [Chitinophagaceae bacterium]